MNYVSKFILLIYLTAIIGLYNQVNGQSGTRAETDSIGVKTIPVALELGEIPAFGNETRTLINDVHQITNEGKTINDISTGIDEVANTLDDKLLIVTDTLNELRLARLEKEARELKLLEERISPWKKSIEEIRDNCRLKDSMLLSMTEVWQLTLSSLASEKVTNNESKNSTEELKAQVENFIIELENSQIELENYVDSIRNIQAGIAFLENKVGTISSIIESKEENFNQDIWIPESPPIWIVAYDTTKMTAVKKYVGVIKSDLSIIDTFFKTNPKLPFYIIFLFAIIFGAIWYLKTNSKNLFSNIENMPQDVKFVLNHPIPTSLIMMWVISLSFSIFPKELDDIFSLLIMLPLVVMLYKLNDHWKWYTALIFSTSYFLFLIIRDFDYSSLIPRLFLIALNIYALYLFSRFKRHKSVIKESGKFWFGTFSLVNQFLLIVTAISLLANIIGSIRLAQLILYASYGIVVSIYSLRTAVVLARNFAFIMLMGPFAKHSNILKDDSDVVLKKMDVLFRVLGFLTLLSIFLDLFGIKEQAISSVMSIIKYKLTVGEMSLSLGNIIAFVLTLQISIWLSEFIRYVLDKEIYPRSHFKDGVPNTISLMIKFTFALLGILLAFSAAGIQMDKLSILMGALGVGIGFGLQNIIANFVSGVILALERPITIGDIIDIPGASGYVQDIGLRASTVYTWDGSHVIVPNAELVSSKLTNWTFTNRLRRIKVEVRVPFDTDIEILSKLLLKTANTLPEVMKKPKAYLNYKGIGQSAMEIDLYCWTDDSDKIFTYGTSIRKAIYKTLRDEGYEIPVPVQDVNIDKSKEVNVFHKTTDLNSVNEEKNNKTDSKD